MEEVVKETWNIKKIIAALVLLSGISAGGFFAVNKYYFQEKKAPEVLEEKNKSVKGTNIIENEQNEEKSDDPDEKDIDLEENIKEKISDLKEQVEKLDLVEIASSSPQVQKVINDIKSLEQYPVTKARDVCNALCENIK
jgi:hypothetical protein